MSHNLPPDALAHLRPGSAGRLAREYASGTPLDLGGPCLLGVLVRVSVKARKYFGCKLFSFFSWKVERLLQDGLAASSHFPILTPRSGRRQAAGNEVENPGVEGGEEGPERRESWMGR